MQYEKDTCTLQRTNGARIRRYDFAGQNLEYLINLLGETEVTVLVNPDDFRRVCVPVGDDFRLVELINKDVDERTPAYSFKAADELLKRIAEEQKNKNDTSRERRDIFKTQIPASSTLTAPTRATKATSRETVRKTKEHAAIHRAAQAPLPEPNKTSISPTHSLVAETPSPGVWSFDESRICSVENMNPSDKP